MEEFQPLDDFGKKIDELVNFTKSRKSAPGFREVLLPGEMSRRRAELYLKEGIEIYGSDWANMLQWGTDLGVKDLPEPL